MGTFRKLYISPGLYIHLNWLAKTELRRPGRYLFLLITVVSKKS